MENGAGRAVGSTPWPHIRAQIKQDEQRGAKQTVQPRAPAWENKSLKPLIENTPGVGRQQEKLPASQERLLERPTGA